MLYTFMNNMGVMLAGYLFTSRRGKLRRPLPPFTGGMAEAIHGSSIVETVGGW